MDVTGYSGYLGGSPSAVTGSLENPMTGFSQSLADISGSSFGIDRDEGIGDAPEDKKYIFEADFSGWIDRGESDNVVYFGIKNGKPVYTGITKQLVSARLEQHNRNGKGFSTLEIQHSGLKRNQARAVEQYYIDRGPNELNIINSIAPNHRYRMQADQWALYYLSKK